MRSVDKRSLEVKASQGVFAKTKLIAATLYNNFLKTPGSHAGKVWKGLRKVHKVIKSPALYNAEGVYADYVFNGENVHYTLLDKQVKTLQEEELKKPEAQRKKHSHAIALTDILLMQKLLDHGVNFDANESAQKRMRELISILCPNGIQFIDEQSKKHLLDAVRLSEETGKKLIVLSNHVSHMDAVVIDAFFKQLRNQGLVPKEKKNRFIEGVYMALTPGVRQFSIAFNTTKVIGESDMQMLLSAARKNNTEVTIEYEYGEEIKKITTTPMKQIKELKRQVKDKYFASADKEIGIIFQYAGRGENGGVKECINPHMHEFLTSDKCIYISFNMHDTDQLKPTKTDFFIGAHTRFQPYDIHINVSEPWIGGEKSLEEIHRLSLEQRDFMRPEYAGIEKKKMSQKIIEESIIAIQDILGKTYAARTDGTELNEEDIKEYNQLYDQYIRLLNTTV